MIRMGQKKDCCGCNACGDVCPVKAISFERDGEGFLYPKVDEARCIDCGLCEKVCPWIDTESKRNNADKPQCYAAVHKNLTTRFASTSGGAFTAFASVIYRQGGYVGGAIWDGPCSVKQFLSNEKTDLLRLRESKLTQSDARGFYLSIGDALKSGSPVLVCGTPCQMVALRSYLAVLKIPTDNLFVIDFICCGVNSPLVFEEFLRWKEKEIGSKVKTVRIKNKELGWRNLTMKLTFENGTVKYDTRGTCLFTKGFIGIHQFCRPSCYECRCKGSPRFADITIGDYWGAPKLLDPGMDNDIGTSVLFVNNSKGAKLLDMTKHSLRLQELSFESAVGGNLMFFKSLERPSVDRNEFFGKLKSGGFDAVKGFITDAKCNRAKSLSGKIRNVLSIVRVWRRRLRGLSVWRTIRLNRIGDILCGRSLLLACGPIIFERTGDMALGGDLRIGGGFFKTALHISALAIRKGGALITHGANTIYYGADIEVFENARLEIGEGCIFNLNANIICGGSIKIGDGVSFGRNVTIRDNNGGHWTNLLSAKQTAPVEIADHVWLCEGCTIMPGVKVGAGAIVGAKAVVFGNVPPNTLVLGNPAKVVAEGVEWKR